MGLVQTREGQKNGAAAAAAPPAKGRYIMKYISEAPPRSLYLSVSPLGKETLGPLMKRSINKSGVGNMALCLDHADHLGSHTGLLRQKHAG